MMKNIMYALLTINLIMTVNSCSLGQAEQNICNSSTNGAMTAQLCMKSYNCLNILPNSTCQIELSYYSTYTNTTYPSPAIYNEIKQDYFWVKVPDSFEVSGNNQCPPATANQQICQLTVTFTGNSNITSPFMGKINVIPSSESDIITSITISGTSS
jgi:hypothetical protein